MNYLNKAILKKYENHWITLRDAGYISNLTKTQVEELLSVYNQELDPNYTVNKWCMSCVAEMVRILYLATKYDEIKEEKFSDHPAVQEFLSAFSEDQTEEVKEVEQPKPQPKKRGRKKKK